MRATVARAREESGMRRAPIFEDRWLLNGHSIDGHRAHYWRQHIMWCELGARAYYMLQSVDR